MSRRVIVVGAGPGGLASSMLLAAAGFDVKIVERLGHVGGRTSTLEVDGFRFDRGPTFFLFPEVLEGIFRMCGRNLNDEVHMTRLDPNYRLQFEQGGSIDSTCDVERLKREIAKIAPADAERVDNYLADNRRKLHKFRPILESAFNSHADLLKLPLMDLLPHMRPWSSVDTDLKRYFDDPRIRLACSFQSKYLGMSPFKCPSLFTILAFLEYEYGVFHPRGGCGAVSQAMARVARQMGVEIHLNEPVEEVLLDGRRATGVRTRHGVMDADALVINADFARAMETLVPDHARRRWTDRKLAKKRYSCSTFMLYLGLEGECPDLAHHTVFLSDDYERHLQDIETRYRLTEHPSFYVQNPCVTDPGMAPDGCSSLYVLVPVPHMHRNIDWAQEQPGFRRRTLARLEQHLGLENLERRIRVERTFTPADWSSDLNLYKGSTFSLAHSLDQMLSMRPRNRFEDLDGVYLTGGGTHPGSGLPVIYESARISARLLAEDFGVSHPWADLERQTEGFEEDRVNVAAVSQEPSADAPANILSESRSAQRAWRTRSIDARLAVIRRARGLIASDVAGLAGAVSVPTRASAADTALSEVLPVLDACRFLERRAGRVLSTRRESSWQTPMWLSGVSLEVRREPHGVILVIGPSNYPLMLTAVPALHALAAGNAVVIKPGAGGEAANRLFVAVLERAGLPSGLLVCVDDSAATGKALLAAGPDKVVFTGSAGTGRAVLGELAARVTPAVMELSGCDAAFVLPGADLELTARALAFGLTFNGSATCIAPRRVFVPDPLAGALQEQLTRALRHAPERRLDARTRRQVAGIVEDAEAGGARVASGNLGATSMTPLVLANADAGMRIAREDLFAPVLALIPVASEEAALAQAQRCPYALGATVFGPAVAARALAAQVNAGAVVINDMIVPSADARVPFGGRGESGFGTMRGAEGLLEMTRPKALVTRRGNTRRHFVPLDPGAGGLVNAYLEAAYGVGWRTRVRGVGRLLRGISESVKKGRSER